MLTIYRLLAAHHAPGLSQLAVLQPQATGAPHTPSAGSSPRAWILRTTPPRPSSSHTVQPAVCPTVKLQHTSAALAPGSSPFPVPATCSLTILAVPLFAEPRVGQVESGEAGRKTWKSRRNCRHAYSLQAGTAAAAAADTLWSLSSQG